MVPDVWPDRRCFSFNTSAVGQGRKVATDNSRIEGKAEF
jgi:hypothetical protein